MIVLPRGEGLLLVHQHDHAALSADVAGFWRRPSAPGAPLWERFLAALRRHDDGWREAEAAPLLDELGTPYDFKSMPAPEHMDVWRRSVELAGRQDPYQALLVARHARWLYEVYSPGGGAGSPEAAETFRREMEERIAAVTARLGAGSREERAAVEAPVLESSRRLFSFFDQLSLFLIGAVEGNGIRDRLAFGNDEACLDLRRRGEVLEVSPWPFREPALAVGVEGVEVPAKTFPSSAALAAAIRAARRVPLSWRILAPPGTGTGSGQVHP